MGTYDYIIVGGGTAGCVLANRLCAASARVLLLEAGGADRKREIRIPAAFYKLFKSEVDWAYFTEPEEHLDGRRLFWPRGKVLGGCSSINAMIYIRGHRSDYDAWRDDGNPGWAYEDLLPHFRASESNSRGSSEWHAHDGPLSVSDQRCPHPLTIAFMEACRQTGIEINADFNAAEQEGAGLFQVTQKNGARCSAADGFVKPLLRDRNLTVITDALATKILFEGSRATGLEYVKNGNVQRVFADVEVIVSGGAINSPQLLMLSGIGPAEQLKQFGIPVIHDSISVGSNLQDHIACGVMYHCNLPITLDSAETLWNVLNFFARRQGPLTSNVAEAGAFVRSSSNTAIPDLQLFFGPAFFVDHGLTRPGGPGFSFGVVLLRPESRGHIRLRSSDPTAAPLIYANYLSSEADRKIMVAGLRIARKIASAKAFDVYRGKEYMPGAEAISDDALWQHLRQRAETMYHPVGTCRMGSDAGAVVDPQLRVNGVKNLRVVDASIMPTLVGGNTNAPTMVIAEKAATMIMNMTDAAHR